MKRAVIQIRQDEDELSAIAAMGERFVSTWKSGSHRRQDLLPLRP